MKKILYAMFFCVLLLFFFIPKEVYAEDYSTYESMIFENKEVELLSQWSYYDNLSEKEYVNQKKVKMFGWNIHYRFKEEPFTFVAETIYRIENSGLDNIVHTFKYEETTEETIQKNVSGSLQLSGTKTTEKKFKFGLETELKFEYKDTLKTKSSESDSIKVTVAPGCTLEIKIKGEGKLTQGYARKYFCFINVKEGGFEYVVVTTEYYEISMYQNGE